MSSTDDRFNACAVEPDVAARMRVKQAATAVHTFKSVLLLSSLSEARQKLEADSPFDVFFISERIPPADITTFIQTAKEHRHGEDAAFILLIGACDELKAKSAKALLIGFDSCLMEPYSVDALVEITRLTSEVKNRRREERNRSAMDMLLQTIIRQVDRRAYIQSCGMDPGETMKHLRGAQTTLRAFDASKLDVYYQEAIKLFETAPATSLTGRRNYNGVSQRVKKNVVQRLIRDGAKEHAGFQNKHNKMK